MSQQHTYVLHPCDLPSARIHAAESLRLLGRKLKGDRYQVPQVYAQDLLPYSGLAPVNNALLIQFHDVPTLRLHALLAVHVRTPHCFRHRQLTRDIPSRNLRKLLPHHSQ